VGVGWKRGKPPHMKFTTKRWKFLPDFPKCGFSLS
jgi:hypothetical protein